MSQQGVGSESIRASLSATPVGRPSDTHDGAVSESPPSSTDELVSAGGAGVQNRGGEAGVGAAAGMAPAADAATSEVAPVPATDADSAIEAGNVDGNAPSRARQQGAGATAVRDASSTPGAGSHAEGTTTASAVVGLDGAQPSAGAVAHRRVVPTSSVSSSRLRDFFPAQEHDVLSDTSSAARLPRTRQFAVPFADPAGKHLSLTRGGRH